MTPYLIELADHQEMGHEADAVIVDPGAALRFTRGTQTSLIVAPRVWRSCRIAGTDPPPNVAHRKTQASDGPPQPSRRDAPQRLAMQAVDIPDTIGH
jgi:hypothetical protein